MPKRSGTQMIRDHERCFSCWKAEVEIRERRLLRKCAKNVVCWSAAVKDRRPDTRVHTYWEWEEGNRGRNRGSFSQKGFHIWMCKCTCPAYHRLEGSLLLSLYHGYNHTTLRASLLCHSMPAVQCRRTPMLAFNPAGQPSPGTSAMAPPNEEPNEDPRQKANEKTNAGGKGHDPTSESETNKTPNQIRQDGKQQGGKNRYQSSEAQTDKQCNKCKRRNVCRCKCKKIPPWIGRGEVRMTEDNENNDYQSGWRMTKNSVGQK